MRPNRHLVGILTFLALTGTAVHSRQAAPKFTLRIPPGIQPETVFGVYQAGTLQDLQTREGIRDYTLIPPRLFPESDVRRLKLLLYVPGFRMVTAEFGEAELREPRIFVPSLEKLATTRFEGVVVDTNGRPIANRRLVVRYFLMEAMPYFGYFDGSFPIIPIANVATGSDGRFSIDIPSFSDDGFFAKSGSIYSGVQLHIEPRAGDRSGYVTPSKMEIQKTYGPQTLTFTRLGRVSGTLSPDFIQQNGLARYFNRRPRQTESYPRNIELWAMRVGTGLSHNLDLKIDGSFELELKPGTYNLELQVSTPGRDERRIISVQRGVVVEEDARLQIQP